MLTVDMLAPAAAGILAATAALKNDIDAKLDVVLTVTNRIKSDNCK